ncbi:LysM peptidoglycan-binding domain-containing protein [Celeribacter persicus]|uniref:Nucleoid-associated protein YgaU n=1 Tax=Celeribacter persicus TaxID=1651082 RepID=A0A2T5HUF1_9RHOB|nr:LysM peptidoglycan-binding domain-containing protein [Celeribacter persicus]PTQ75176.1 nucleoid-associated protein YgaU [Celeribacter persicus]
MATQNKWMMPAAGVGAAVLVVAIGAVLYLGRPGIGDAPEALPQTVAAVPPGGDAQSAPAESAEAVPTPAQILPSFDLVRIPPHGLATVAGQAEPGTEVHILVDGTEVAKAEINDRGEFVALFALEASGEAREMQLVSGTGERALASAESILIAPASPATDTAAGDGTAEVALADGADIPAPESEEVTSVTQETVMSGGAPLAAAGTGTAIAGQILEGAAAAAPTVLMANDEGVKVLQQDGTTPGALHVDAVSYDPEGRVFVSGRAEPGAALRLYLDQDFIARTVAGEDGQWRAELEGVAAGRYKLRADQVDAWGAVVSRAEIPFHREEVALLAQIAGDTPQAEASVGEDEAGAEVTVPASRIASVTVQPGNTLWGIATKRYGDGFLYVRVFDANRDQIRNPDLIYPGQIFQLPEE